MARNSASPKPAQSGSTRCAIYTRKSSEDGLEQEFNSLDAQREACLAYITSQRHEGWKALPTHYDDGGFSGGTLNRPAVQRLLADIRAGRIDLVVIYKVDTSITTGYGPIRVVSNPNAAAPTGSCTTLDMQTWQPGQWFQDDTARIRIYVNSSDASHDTVWTYKW